jgi:hypothetical protein
VFPNHQECEFLVGTAADFLRRLNSPIEILSWTPQSFEEHHALPRAAPARVLPETVGISFFKACCKNPQVMTNPLQMLGP